VPQSRMTKWYPFKDDSVDLAPETTGIYELGYNKVIVYIGKAETSIKSRLCEHRKRKTFMKVTQFRFKILTWKSDAAPEEKRLKEDFKKKNNGNLPRLQKR